MQAVKILLPVYFLAKFDTSKSPPRYNAYVIGDHM